MSRDGLDPPFGSDDVEVLERQTCFRGFFRVDRLRLRHRAYAGGWVGPVTREVFLRGEAAAVMPFDPDNNFILLVEQFRVGALEWRDTPWCLELIAGMADVAGEATTELVRREAREEAAVELLEIEPIFSYMPSPGGSDERLHLFVARADLSAAGGIHGSAGEGEDIRALKVTTDQIPELLSSGRVDNAATLIALQWLQLHKSGLCARWRGRT